MKKHLIFAVLALLCGLTASFEVAAQSARPYACFPKTMLTPLATGSARVTVRNTQGESHAWWCEVPHPTIPGQVSFRIERLTCLKRYCVNPDFAGSVSRMYAASSPVAALNAEVAAAIVVLAPGSMDKFYYEDLEYKSCLLIATPPFELAVPQPLRADICGLQPVPPSAPAEVWKTPTNGSTVWLSANNKLVSKVAGKTSPPKALCNLTVAKAVSGTSTYGSFPGAVGTEVTLCLKEPS